MLAVAKFEKVPFEQFADDYRRELSELMPDGTIKYIYDHIKLPERKTTGSAGYDFFSPVDFVMLPNKVINIPTGIRCEIKDGWVLNMYMRSGLGFKHGLRLINGTGIIDSDYYHADNFGHIHIKIINDSALQHTVPISMGDGIAQGIFLPFGVTVDDHAKGKRTGGFGSTDNKKTS